MCGWWWWKYAIHGCGCVDGTIFYSDYVGAGDSGGVKSKGLVLVIMVLVMVVKVIIIIMVLIYIMIVVII